MKLIKTLTVSALLAAAFWLTACTVSFQPASEPQIRRGRVIRVHQATPRGYEYHYWRYERVR